MRPRRSRSIRFESKVDKTSECWLWTGAKNARGYGRLGRGAPDVGVEYAHRAAWELRNGPVPNGLFVCHRCDNPSCVNPDHLFLGTHDANMADMVHKCRQSRGRRHGKTKLTASDVGLIRLASETLDVSQATIAKAFGVTQGAVNGIVTGRSWGHVA